MGRHKGKGRITTSVTISPEFFLLAKENHISFTEAIRVGLSMLFAEKGIQEYDNNLTIVRRMQKLNQKLSETSQKLNQIKEKHESNQKTQN